VRVWALIAGALLGLGGCGWHLAGRYDVPDALEPVYVDAGGVSFALRERLTQALTTGGTQLAEESTAARSVLELRDEKFDREVLSVGVDGKVREHELTYRIGFRMRSVDGTELHPAQAVVLHRDASFDEDNVLGREGEERAARTDMEREAVQQILRRLRAVLARAA
jgi:LPS-assembly lipoprotein